MGERFTWDKLVEVPLHRQNAERFIAAVNNLVGSRFPELDLIAENQTDAALEIFPELVILARTGKIHGAPDEYAQMDRDIEEDSATATVASVDIYGDDQLIIARAAKLIRKQGKRFHGTKTVDSGIRPNEAKQALFEKSQYDSMYEDLPVYSRYLKYRFSE